ncbi:hypothetical protein ACLSU7_10300 [Bdellovibrio sp. HCB185ZH]|uniref:hypothetical protein n=1 Tax=Bdellovibrio sp. HCB185ZH TaxID=3394235 RepID=UPI0039A7193D
MISLSVVIITMVAIIGALWMIIKFNKGEELSKVHRDKYDSRQHPNTKRKVS